MEQRCPVENDVYPYVRLSELFYHSVPFVKGRIAATIVAQMKNHVRYTSSQVMFFQSVSCVKSLLLFSWKKSLQIKSQDGRYSVKKQSVIFKVVVQK